MLRPTTARRAKHAKAASMLDGSVARVWVKAKLQTEMELGMRGALCLDIG